MKKQIKLKLQPLLFQPVDHELQAEREGDLHYACYRGDVKLLAKTLDSIDNINALDSEGRTPLFVAVQKGHTHVVKYLLNHGADPNVTDKRHMSPLHVALTADTTELLIKHGANIDARKKNGDTPLHTAVHHSNVDVFKTLVSNKAHVNAVNNMLSTPLHILCEYVKYEESFAENIFPLLIESKVDLNLKDIDGKTALHVIASTPACLNLHSTIISNGGKLDIADNSGNYPLHYILKNSDMRWNETEHINILKLYLPNKNAVLIENQQGRSILHLLSEEVNSTLIQLAIKEGANVHLTDNFGRTPMHCISNKGDIESVVKKLVSNGSDVDAKDSWGKTPLITAADEINQTLGETLMQQGASVNLADCNGNTALHFACYRNASEFVKLLIRNNADVHSRDANQATPLHAAAYAGSLDCVQILICAGAQTEAYDSEKKRPYDIACTQGNVDMIRVLSNDKTDHNQRKTKLTETANVHVDLETALQMLDDGQIAREQANAEDLLSNLIKSPATGRGADDKEAQEIQLIIENVIQTLAQKLEKTEPYFCYTLLHAGSTSEGTKTRCPDEFDFMLCLEKLSELVEPEYLTEESQSLKSLYFNPYEFSENYGEEAKETQESMKGSCMSQESSDTYTEADFTSSDVLSVSVSDYALLNIKDGISACPSIPLLTKYCIYDHDYDCVPCSKFSGAFSKLIEKILFSKDFPKHPRLIPLEVTADPEIEFRWHGARYKELTIGVDLVPAIRLAKWPERMRKDCKLFTKSMLQRSCLVVPKTTSGQYGELWRCSLALLETNIFRWLRPEIRNSYIACKCMVSSKLMPEIDFSGKDNWSDIYKLRHLHFTDEELISMAFPETVEDHIPSYIIKMTFLSLLEDRVAKHGLKYIYDMATLEQKEKNDTSTECDVTGDCSESSPTTCFTDDKYTSMAESGEADTDDSNTTEEGASKAGEEISVNKEWYGPALTMHIAERSTEFDITIVREVFRELESRLERKFVPSVFNPNHNVLGNRLLSGDVEKALVYVRMINVLLA